MLSLQAQKGFDRSIHFGQGLERKGDDVSKKRWDMTTDEILISEVKSIVLDLQAQKGLDLSIYYG